MTIKVGVLSDNLTAGLPTPALTAINIGDLLWWDVVNKVMQPAQLRADQGSLIANQMDFAKIFLGVSQDMRSNSETSTGHDSLRNVALDVIVDASCQPQTWEVLDLVGIDRNTGTPGNYPQQVNKVTGFPQLAIGYCVQRSSTTGSTTALAAVTLVRCRLISNVFLGSNDLTKLVGSQVLPDASQVLTLGVSKYLSMAPSAARNVTLPNELLASGLTFFFSNRAATAVSVTFLGSLGGSVQGNGVVPQNKTALLWSDGINWNSLVSN